MTEGQTEGRVTRWGHVELDTRVVFKDTAAWARATSEEAEAHGMSRSDFIRWVVHTYINDRRRRASNPHGLDQS